MRLIIIVFNDDFSLNEIEPLLVQSLFPQDPEEKERGICLIPGINSPETGMFRGVHFEHEAIPVIMIGKTQINNFNDLPSTSAEIRLRQMMELGIEEKVLVESFKLIERDNENYTLQFLNHPKPKITTSNSWTSKRTREIKFNKKLLLCRKILQKY